MRIYRRGLNFLFNVWRAASSGLFDNVGEEGGLRLGRNFEVKCWDGFLRSTQCKISLAVGTVHADLCLNVALPRFRAFCRWSSVVA